MGQAMIDFHSVTKQYQGGHPAVDGLTMSIDKGSITVFVGPSGCGKTTSLRMINRMVEPTSGVVMVDGRNVTSVPAAELRRSMGYVMQASGLMPHRSVLDNIATVPRLNGVSKAEARRRAGELLDVVGLASALGKRYPSQASVLGDKVAVFAVGGKLAQYATPEELLRAPANDFVASFVGRDRGFRHLGFTASDGVRIHPVPTLVFDVGRFASDPAAVADWQLVVDRDRRPLGWAGPGTDTELIPGGSLFRLGETLRQALDSALSSPSGQGVAVDGEGRVLGAVRAQEVLAVIEDARRVRQAAL